MKASPSVVAVLALTFVAGCGSREERPIEAPRESEPPAKLSALGLFRGASRDQIPAEGVIPYDLNSPLFSDYTEKFRFVKLPNGKPATYREGRAFDFPVGTIIAKTFAYPRDARDPSKGRRLIETRILTRNEEGWVGLPYVWNEEQTEATLEVAGGTFDATWIHADGSTRTNNYIIPNVNQCKGCHKIGDVMTPIGPKPEHLNRDFAYPDGTENQLARWSRIGALAGGKAPESAPRLAVWNDPGSGSLDRRARAWLDINCAHCHAPDGPARNSGLDLRWTQENPTAFGVMKPPVAAGQGSGGRPYDIVPGRPDDSIMAFRIGSTHPAAMMPELGKRLVHDEGVALIREWIAAMPASR